MSKQLLVESIRMDGETQSRERINEEAVAEYAEALLQQGGGGQATPQWPPVVVFFDGTEFWLADGFHRLLAVRRIGRKNIVADVKNGTREDAAWASCAANQTHGLRRSNADKRKAVEIALGLHPEMSDSALAAHCGVSHPFVGDMRRQVVTVTTSAPPERRRGRDGKQYPGAPERTQRTERQDFGHGGRAEMTAGHGPPPCREERRGGRGGEQPTRLREDATARHARLREDATARHAPHFGEASEEGRIDGRGGVAGPVDDVGRRIPDHLVDLWGRRQEVQDMLTALSRVRVALREAQDNRDPLFSEVPYSSALAHLDQAYDAVQVAKPYAVCAFCQGHGCKACGLRGLLGKFRWDTAVPKEHKEAVARLAEGERRP